MKFLTKENYRARIMGSIGSNFFRTLYFEKDGVVIDITKDGIDSCAFHTTIILKTVGLIEAIHATVTGTITDMEASGWYEIAGIRPNAIIIWKETKGEDGQLHQHTGFAISNTEAVSNNSKERTPQIHDIHFRPIEKILWHKALE